MALVGNLLFAMHPLLSSATILKQNLLIFIYLFCLQLCWLPYLNSYKYIETHAVTHISRQSNKKKKKKERRMNSAVHPPFYCIFFFVYFSNCYIYFCSDIVCIWLFRSTAIRIYHEFLLLRPLYPRLANCIHCFVLSQPNTQHSKQIQQLFWHTVFFSWVWLCVGVCCIWTLCLCYGFCISSGWNSNCKFLMAELLQIFQLFSTMCTCSVNDSIDEKLLFLQ